MSRSIGSLPTRASGKDTQRPELERLLAFAREGDTVVVHSMDRLARNLDDLRLIVQKLTKRGVRIEFVKENLTFTGEDSPLANLMLSVMGAFAEFERALIRERQREGIALAKQRGANTQIGVATSDHSCDEGLLRNFGACFETRPSSEAVPAAQESLDLTQAHAAMHFFCSCPGQDLSRLQDRLAAAGPTYCDEKPVSLGIITPTAATLPEILPLGNASIGDLGPCVAVLSAALSRSRRRCVHSGR